jgi:hypothetical protein
MASDLVGDSPPALVADVNHDGVVAPLDALTIINSIADAGGTFETLSATSPLDLNQDGWVSYADVDVVFAGIDPATLEEEPDGNWSPPGSDLDELDDDPGNDPGNDPGDDPGDEAEDDPGDDCSDTSCGAPPPVVVVPTVRIRSQIAGGGEGNGLRERATKPDPLAPDGYFVVELSTPADRDLTIQFSVDGQSGAGTAAAGFAINGVDHSLIGTTVKVPAGQLSAQVPVLVNNDQLVESPEKIRVILGPGDGYHIVQENPWAELVIRDNDHWSFVADTNTDSEWDRHVMLPEWNASYLQSFIATDPKGWCDVDGEVKWESPSHVEATIDARFHGWNGLPFLAGQQELFHHMVQQVDLRFALDESNGHISLIEGSGPSLGFDVLADGALHVGIGYSYTIDNDFAPNERRVELSLNAVVGILGTMEAERTGGAIANQAALHDEGALDVTHTISGSRSSTPLDQERSFVIRARIAEQD